VHCITGYIESKNNFCKEIIFDIEEYLIVHLTTEISFMGSSVRGITEGLSKILGDEKTGIINYWRINLTHDTAFSEMA
jgi:hypothetical protein